MGPPLASDFVRQIPLAGLELIRHLDAVASAQTYGAGMKRSITTLAAHNNALWCDAVCRAHDRPGEFHDTLWLTRLGAPRTAILYAFDLIERDGEDLRNVPFLDRKAALARLLRHTETGIVLNEHVAGGGPTVFEHACRLGAEGIVSKRVDGTYRSGRCPVWIKVRNPASVAVQRERSEKWNR